MEAKLVTAGEVHKGDWVRGVVPSNRVQVSKAENVDGFKVRLTLANETTHEYDFAKPIEVWR